MDSAAAHPGASRGMVPDVFRLFRVRHCLLIVVFFLAAFGVTEPTTAATPTLFPVGDLLSL